MAIGKLYQDFVGLNILLYEPVGWDVTQQSTETIKYAFDTLTSSILYQNVFGPDYSNDNTGFGIQHYRNELMQVGYPISNIVFNFPTIMAKRNGPYGYPTWKQIRVSQNPLSRKQIKENVLTIVEEPGDEFTFRRNSKIITQRAKYGKILNFTETPVVSKFSPLMVLGQSIVDGQHQGVQISAPLTNNTCQFNNSKLNEKLGRVNMQSTLYENVKKLYLGGNLLSDQTPLDVFQVLLYKETIYPPQVQTYKKHIRQRTTFAFPWNHDREKRRSFPANSFLGSNSVGSVVQQSDWPMDAHRTWETKTKRTTAGIYDYGYTENVFGTTNDTDYGILQNQYCQAENALTGTSGSAIDLRQAPIYNRKHILTKVASCANINGMNVQGVTSGTIYQDLDEFSFPGGEAKWDVPAQSGKFPFFNTYEEYIQDARQVGKEYSIIPEFRISEHVPFYQNTMDPKAERLNLFEMTGGLANTTGSNQQNFYEIYSNSDFLKKFKMVVNDNSEVGEPISITLKCKGIKKLLPYEGFYPQQRTVQLASQFYNSFSASVNVSGSQVSTIVHKPQIGLQNIITPLFAPGILFNSIKSGVAVDYPITIGSRGNDFQSLIGTSGSMVRIENDNYYLSFSGSNVAGKEKHDISKGEGKIFNKRFSFETLLDPSLMDNLTLISQEPHFYTNYSASATKTDITGDKIYSKMMHNFLAECPNFFLENKRYTTFYSKPSNEIPHFSSDYTYMMRVKMYKTSGDAQANFSSGSVFGGASGQTFVAPQYSSTSRENFTMYSRPTAFGPPSYIENDGFIYSAGAISNLSPVAAGNRSDLGENYPFTPPYYHGQAWADIEFKPSIGGAYSLKDVIAQSKVTYYRYVDANTPTINTTTAIETIFDKTNLTQSNSSAYGKNYIYNQNALQLSASVNLFTLERDSLGDLNEETARWIVQTKWETPMLNFNHLGAASSVTLPINASQSVPRGMWHQYGQVEQNENKGIFLQVTAPDESWVRNILGKNPDKIRNLADHVEFRTTPSRLGEIASEKTIREAVVAVPFVEQEGERRYFHIPRNTIDAALALEQGGTFTNAGIIGSSIRNQISQMRRYVFPPSMDFLADSSIVPFAMYIFEFQHQLDKQDLADIWQGVYPKITSVMEESSATISHPLLATHVLGGGPAVNQFFDQITVDTNVQGNPLPPKTKWMVFKVKQRAETNYYRAMYGATDDKLNEVGNYSYNWPYDFFSLVELAKIDVGVALGEAVQTSGDTYIIESQGQTQAPPQPQPTGNDGGSGGYDGGGGGSTGPAPGTITATPYDKFGSANFGPGPAPGSAEGERNEGAIGAPGSAGTSDGSDPSGQDDFG